MTEFNCTFNAMFNAMHNPIYAWDRKQVLFHYLGIKRRVLSCGACLVVFMVVLCPVGHAQSSGTASADSAPQLVTEQAEDLAEVQYQKALQILKAGQRKLAVAMLRTAVKNNPKHLSARFELGRLLRKVAPDEAMKHLQALIAIQPYYPPAYYHMGWIEEGKGRYQEAMVLYRKTIHLNPNAYFANQRLRKLLQQLRKYQTIIDKAQERLADQPTLVNLTLFGRLVMNKLTPAVAVQRFVELQQDFPKLPEIILWQARAQRAGNNVAGEIAAYAAYVEQKPYAWSVNLLLIERLQKEGRHWEASRRLQEMEKALPQTSSDNIQDFYGNLLFLKSQYESTSGYSGTATLLLFKAAKSGYSKKIVHNAFQQYKKVHGYSGVFWLHYGAWLEQQYQMKRAAAAYYRAGRLAAAVQRTAATKLTKLHYRLARWKKVSASFKAQLQLNATEMLVRAGRIRTARKWFAKLPSQSQNSSQGMLIEAKLYRIKSYQRGRKRIKGKLLDEKEAALLNRYLASLDSKASRLLETGRFYWRLNLHLTALNYWGKNRNQLKSDPLLLREILRWAETRNRTRVVWQYGLTLYKTRYSGAENAVRLGMLAESGDNLPLAVAYWKKALEIWPTNFALLIRSARAELDLDNAESGILLLRRAVQIRPVDQSLSLFVGQVLIDGEHYEEALRVYWDLYQVSPEHWVVAGRLPELVLKAPSEPAVKRVAVRFAMQQEDLASAAKILEQLLQQNPAEIEARQQLVEIYLSTKHPFEADRVLVAKEAQSIRANYLDELAGAYRKLNAFPQEARVLDELQQQNPKDRKVKRRRGVVLYQIGKRKQAEPLLVDAHQYDSNDAQVAFLLAQYDLAAKRWNPAIKKLQIAASAQYEYQKTLKLLIRMYEQNKNWQKTAEMLEKYLTQWEKDERLRYNLAVVYLKIGNKSKAKLHYEHLRARKSRYSRGLSTYFR